MTTTTDRLYKLLPAIYRSKDADQEQSLRALFAILEQEFTALEADIQGLYDNWFIETCDEWVVPYIGDLLKVPVLHSGGIAGFSLRSYVANVLAYRRRKGTASVLEQMAHDVSGWPARVVEFYKSLATTQNLNHVRPATPASIDLHDTNKLELLGSPFQQAAYTTEVRSVIGGRGKYNIPNIGLFLWRLQSYVINKVQACSHGGNRFCFNPLGIDQPLFNRPQTETDISHLAEEQNVPGPLRRRPLFDELQARRDALANGEAPKEIYFGAQPVLQVYVDGETLPLLPEQIMICDLSDWDSGLSPVPTDIITVQVDPALGRLAFPGVVTRVDVSYAYGFSADVGGGPYNRNDSLADLFSNEDRVWWAGVTEVTNTEPRVYATLTEAIQAWNALDAASSADVGVIAILDNATYEDDLTGDDGKIVIPAGKKLLIVAAQWLGGQIPQDTDWSPELGLGHFLTASRLRPHLKGNISVVGTGTAGSGELYLNGMLIEGKLTVLVGELGRLGLSHCTLVPAAGGLDVNVSSSPDGGHNEQLAIYLERSICGPLVIPDAVKSVSIIDSIIDAKTHTPPRAISGNTSDPEQFAPPTSIERSTIFGTTYCKELPYVSEAIFTQTVKVERLQAGCVRFSYVPPDSEVPRRFRCQPDLALTDRLKQLSKESNGLITSLNDMERRRVELWMRPVFTSLRYGDPAYAQLKMACPECPRGIRVGAEDGSEMGVFSHLKQPQREDNIRTNLKEYLRFGMEAEIFYSN